MAKERIKENVIDAPTLFVGVGGTGCRIVRRVAEMCRPGERENVNFVCLDTNVNDLASVSGSRHMTALHARPMTPSSASPVRRQRPAAPKRRWAAARATIRLSATGSPAVDSTSSRL